MRAKVPVVPTALCASKMWRLNSWDRFMVPKPFSRLLVAFGRPIAPPPADDPEDVERVRAEVEARLNELQHKTETTSK